MSYVDTSLMPGEQVTHRAEIHGIIFLPGLLLLPILIGVLLLLAAWVAKATTEMAVTNRRVILKRGWLARRVVELNLQKVENVSVDQGILGRLLDYGTVTVAGSGGTKEVFEYVRSPLAFKAAIQAGIGHR